MARRAQTRLSTENSQVTTEVAPDATSCSDAFCGDESFGTAELPKTDLALGSVLGDSFEAAHQQQLTGTEVAGSQNSKDLPSCKTDRRLAKLPKIANAFPGGTAKVPNNPGVAAGFEAIFHGGPSSRSLMDGSAENESGRVHYVHPSRKGGRILVYPSSTSHEQFSPATESCGAT
jgi:hypothetical protein